MVALPALAADYGTDLHISSDDDLYNLHEQGQLEDDDLETLVDLYDTGVDLNTATREELYALPTLTYDQVDQILEYRKLDGFIEDPLALVVAGAITQDQLLQIAPFLIVSERGAAPPLSGRARLQTRYALQDPVAPPLLLQSRLKLPYDLSAGIAVTTTRLRLGQVSWDPSAELLLAKPASYGLAVPKLFLQWKSTHRTLLAGSFRIGFAERLTLDNTRLRTPDGVSPDDTMYVPSDQTTFCRYSKTGGAEDVCGDLDLIGAHVTPDYRWPEGFRGLAGSIEELEVGSAKLDLHAFASYQTRSIYQYDVFNQNACTDPREGGDNCSAPPLYEAPDATRRYAYSTLPDVFDELAGGGNATLHFNGLTRIGLTGYYATELWQVPGAPLDFQDTSRYPFNGSFGAIGVNGATRLGPFDLFAEVARSLNSEPDGRGGGFAVEQRTVYSQRKQELELSLRYYDRDFINPFARPISEPDELQGQRARNELGARFRYAQAPNEDWRLRALADLWVLPYDGKVEGTAGAPNFSATARADFVGWRFFTVGAWAKFVEKSINPCTGDFSEASLFAFSGDETSFTTSDVCDPHYLRFTTRAGFAPFGQWLTFALQPSYKRGLSSGGDEASIWLEVASRPVESWTLRARTRYFDIRPFDDVDRTERTSYSWVEVAWSPGRQFSARLRYDVRAFLDQRDGTLERTPNPEHRFRLVLATKF